MLGVVKHVELRVSQREEANLVSLHRHLLPPVDDTRAFTAKAVRITAIIKLR